MNWQNLAPFRTFDSWVAAFSTTGDVWCGNEREKSVHVNLVALSVFLRNSECNQLLGGTVHTPLLLEQHQHRGCVKYFREY